MKSHFQFSNKQRNGIFLLVIIIVIAQCLYVFADFSDSSVEVESNEIEQFQRELDSLRLDEIEKRKPKVEDFPIQKIEIIKLYLYL